MWSKNLFGTNSPKKAGIKKENLAQTNFGLKKNVSQKKNLG